VTPLELPDPNPERLGRSPLELVVCQIRHESLPVLDGRQALALRDEIGPDLYPTIEQAQAHTIEVVGGPQRAPTAQVGAIQQGWEFKSEAGDWLVSVMPEHVALQTTAYTTWEGDFQGRLAAIVQAVDEHVGPAIEHRLGLRYVDQIPVPNAQIDTAVDWQPYFVPELLGLISNEVLGSAVVGSRQQVDFVVIGDVRCSLRHGFSLLPNGKPGPYVLDFDVYREKARAFDTTGILQTLDEFNRTAVSLFQQIISDALFESIRTEE
jgi:uncharacterized protein (TIGR04255 family)